MIRVAYDTGPLHGPRTGIGVAVEQLSLALAASSPDVELHPYLLSFRATIRPGTTRLRYPAAAALRTWARFGTPRPDRRLGDVDVVHGTNYVVPPSRRPRLVSVYDCWALDNPERVHRDVRLMIAALRRAIDDGAHVHASSHATAARLREHFPHAPTTVVHLGAPPIRPVKEPGEGRDSIVPDTGNLFVAIGTVERRTNLPFLVSLFDDVVAVVPDARLVLVGAAGDDQSAVVAARDRLRHRDRVHLLGRVDAPTLSGLTGRARVLAYPSLDEGFGFPVLEAMAAGVPVVASAVGSIPEVAGDAALLRRCDDRAGWTEALSTALTDESVRHRLATAGTARLAAFDWTRTASEMTALYTDLATRG
ncbi:MAG: glycosyltransferase family 4 protein [Actinomycetota bacterium]